MKIINTETKKLKPYKGNAKTHGERQINAVAESIRQFGFTQPVVIDKDGVIIIGHCRVLAAKQLGIKEVPCVIKDELTDEQIKALRLADNKTNESPWDTELLAAELGDLEGFDMSAFGFDITELEEEEDPNIVEEEIKPFSKVYFLIECEKDAAAEVIELLKPIKSTEGVKVESTVG